MSFIIRVKEKTKGPDTIAFEICYFIPVNIELTPNITPYPVITLISKIHQCIRDGLYTFFRKTLISNYFIHLTKIRRYTKNYTYVTGVQAILQNREICS